MLQSRNSGSMLSPSRQSSGSIDTESIPYETLGSDLCLDEAVRRVRDLTRENQNLRESVEQSNELMKKQCRILTDWRDKWEQEREQMRSHHDQAKTVVTQLRSDLETKDSENEELRQKLSQLKKDETMPETELELLTLRQHKVALCEQLESLRTKTEGLEDVVQKLQSDRDEGCQEMDRYIKLLSESNSKTSTLEEEKAKLESKVVQISKLLEVEEKKLKEQSELQKAATDDALSDAEFSLATINLEEKAASIFGPDHPQGQTMSSLLQQLQEERTKVSDLMTTLQAKNEALKALHGKYNEVEERQVKTEQERQTLLHAKQNEVAGLKNQLAAINSELRSSRPSLDSQCSEEEQRHLKAQVQSLVSELRSKEEKNKSSSDLYARQKERVQALEQEVFQLRDDREVQREKDDKLIRTLQTSIRHLEEQLTTMKNTELHSRQSNEDLLKKLNYNAQEFQKHLRACSANKPDLSADKLKRSSMKVDNLTAQLLTAEEAMDNKMQEIKELSDLLDKMRQENGRLKSDLEDMPILRAQVEVYKSDFEAERAAREREHDSKTETQEELKQLHQRNQQLQEELENLSSNQMAEMYRRHGTRHASADSSARSSSVQPEYAMEPEEEKFVCPLCNYNAPDSDTLQLHCLECIR